MMAKKRCSPLTSCTPYHHSQMHECGARSWELMYHSAFRFVCSTMWHRISGVKKSEKYSIGLLFFRAVYCTAWLMEYRSPPLPLSPLTITTITPASHLTFFPRLSIPITPSLIFLHDSITA